MQYTKNYELKKPELNDFYNVEDFNENVEKIDKELKSNAEKIDIVSTSVDDIANAVGTEKLQTTAQSIIPAINEISSVAKGKNRAKVFATTESMNEWLSNQANARVAQVGDNLYIVDVGVPDWWISEVLTEQDETGRYYKIAQLETQKVDLTTYEARIAAINTELGKKVTTGSQAKLDNVGLGNSDTALIYSENDDVSFRFKGKNGDTLYTNLKTITGDINVIADRGRYYVELCSLYSSDNNATLTKPVDNILGYSYLLFCFIYGNKYYDTKLIPAKLFTEVMNFAGALRLHKANGEDAAAEVWWDGSQICTFINTAYHTVRVYGIA